MTVIVTEAVILHAFDYLESSRILRLATREAGLQSVLARGVRRPKSRFGSGLDLFTEGTAQIAVRPGRDLQTLTGFDVARRRSALGEDLDRFAGANALAEMALRFGGDEAAPELFDVLVSALDAVAAAPAEQASETALAGAWRLVAEMGFAPALDSCASCHDEIAADVESRFSHSAGGALCPRCGAPAGQARTLPASARAALMAWIGDASAERLGGADVRAHQRLLREFLMWHLADGKELRAYAMWEGNGVQ